MKPHDAPPASVARPLEDGVLPVRCSACNRCVGEVRGRYAADGEPGIVLRVVCKRCRTLVVAGPYAPSLAPTGRS